MPTMVTFRAGRVVLIALLAGLAAACSREQEDWRSAESANSAEGWQRFLDQHPDSELVNLARTRIAQLEVQRDFQHADRVGTIEAYRNFLAHHPSGRWSEQARIRIEAFSLGSAPRIAPPTAEEAAAAESSAVRALRLATAAVAMGEGAAAASGMEATQADADQPAASGGAQPQPGTGRAVPGEAAEPASDPVIKPASAVDVGAQSGYGVQLGAFGSEASADREWRRLRGRFGAELGSLSPRIVVAQTDSGELYRLQAPADGEAQARAICDSLREQEQACVTVVSR
jgi:hypothetical protein